MGMDLTRGSEWRPITHAGWREVTSAALAFGWRPQGTAAPEWELEDGAPMPGLHSSTLDGWDGSYLENMGQRVEPDDALALARALRSAIAVEPKQCTWMQPMLAFVEGGASYIW